MGKFYLIVILFIGLILGVITLFNQNKSSSSSMDDLALQNPTIQPTKELQKASQEQTTKPNPTTGVVPQTLWVTNASTAAIKTPKGEITIQLYQQDAPKTVTNFATLAKIGYFNNLTFHRVEPGFVIQGGDPNGNGTGGQSIYGTTFEDELNPKTPSYQEGYTEGVVAMANRGTNTNGSQFFIMLANNETLPKNYTIFGKVTSGMDVVKKIAVGDKILTIVVE